MSVFLACCCGIRCFFLKSLWAQIEKYRFHLKNQINSDFHKRKWKQVYARLKSDGTGASEMGQQVEELAVKSDNQSSIPRIHTGRKN